MPTITVRLFATLRQYHPQAQSGTPINTRVEEGATVGRLIEHLGIPKESVRVAFVNGVVVSEATALREGDDVGIFPPIAGGGDDVESSVWRREEV